jgi:His-Xaa-Ser system protein HxsD
MQNPKNIQINEDHAIFKINPKIYPLELVYSAAYIMIDKAFIVLDGDPDTEIIAEIRKKNDERSLNELVQLFNEELLNYAVYKTHSEKNKALREIILQRVLLTNAPSNAQSSNRNTPKSQQIRDTEKATLK